MNRFTMIWMDLRDSRRSGFVTLITFLAFSMCGAAVLAQQRSYEQEPFDLIYLATQPEPIAVFPIDFPGRRVPSSPKASHTFRVRMLSRPDQEFEVQWGSVRKIELFEQQILADATKLISEADAFARRKDNDKAQEKFDEAFEYLAFLNEKYPSTPGLQKETENFLIQEARKLLANKQFERAWFLLHEAYEKNPGRKGLTAALRMVLDRMFSASIRNRDFVDARRIFSVTKERYGSDLQELQDKWRAQMEQFGKQLLTLAEEKLAERDYRDSYIASRKLLDLWPETPGALEFTKKIAKLYPIISVGVTSSYSVGSDSGFNNRSARRVDRLLERRLFEITDVGTEGGIYNCPFGRSTISNDGLSMELQLGSLQQNDVTVSGLSIARELRNRADPASNDYDALWFYLYGQVNVPQVYELNLKLQHPCLRMESLLSMPLQEASTSSTKLAPYLMQPNDDPNQMVFVANPEYIARTDSMPREIIERRFEDTQAAINALRRSEIDVVGRFLPAETRSMKNDRNIRIGTYRIPSTHFLVPNNEKRFSESRAFRAALLYGIDREKILNRDLLGGVQIKGCRIISGPFSPGIGNDDPIGYAYDNGFSPRAYDPNLAKIRLELAKIEVAKAITNAGEKPPAVPKIVLAHPDDEIPRLACNEISANWQAIGIEVELRVIPSDKNKLDDNDWDFMYADVVVDEPLIAAHHLLSSDGFAQCSSPYLNLALRQLGQADNWNEARRRLKAIHQACFDDVSIIPLWQVVDHFAVRSDFSGLGEQPVHLYQNIENWRISSP